MTSRFTRLFSNTIHLPIHNINVIQFINCIFNHHSKHLAEWYVIKLLVVFNLFRPRQFWSMKVFIIVIKFIKLLKGITHDLIIFNYLAFVSVIWSLQYVLTILIKIGFNLIFAFFLLILLQRNKSARVLNTTLCFRFLNSHGSWIGTWLVIFLFIFVSFLFVSLIVWIFISKTSEVSYVIDYFAVFIIFQFLIFLNGLFAAIFFSHLMQNKSNHVIFLLDHFIHLLFDTGTPGHLILLLLLTVSLSPVTIAIVIPLFYFNFIFNFIIDFNNLKS